MRAGAEVSKGSIFDRGTGKPWATIDLAEKSNSDLSKVTLYFDRVEDIVTLVAALQDLGNRLAEAEPDAVAHAVATDDGNPIPEPYYDGVPWPVATGADTTGWSDSQKLGEQPPPFPATPLYPPAEWNEAPTDELPIHQPGTMCVDCKSAEASASRGDDRCAACGLEVDKIQF